MRNENEALPAGDKWWFAAVLLGVPAALALLASTFLVPYPFLWANICLAPIAQGFTVGLIIGKTSTPATPGVGRASIATSILFFVTLAVLTGGASYALLLLGQFSHAWVLLVFGAAHLGNWIAVRERRT